MRTVIYIDGFNLFYGAVKGTAYKWLDVHRLSQLILQPHHDIVGIKYFTGRVQSTPTDPKKDTRQARYLDALKAHIPNIDIIFGQYKIRQQRGRLISPPHLAAQCNGVAAIEKPEEKGSDVNLAVHMVRDAFLNEYDCAVVISNDSDLAEAWRIVRYDCQKKVGWLLPIRRRIHASSVLASIPPHFRKTIRAGTLRAAQLPDPIPGTTIHKPQSWL